MGFGRGKGFSPAAKVKTGRFEHYITGDDIDAECWEPEYWLAQTFTPSVSHKITSVKLLLYRSGSGALPGTVTVSIRASSADKPTGSDIDGVTGTTDGDTLPTTSPYEWREITLSSGINLTAGTTYAIVVRCLSSDINNMLSWRADEADGAYAGGIASHSTTSGVSWSTSGNVGWDFLFEDWGHL